METIVIGHRNPDQDAISAAVAYAHLKQAQGMENVTAGRAGNLTARIEFVLGKFGVPAPPLFADVTPLVRDVMEADVITVRADATVTQAIGSIDEHQLRGLPVVGEDQRCLGLLSAHKITHQLFPSRGEAERARQVTATLGDILRTFDGELLVGACDPAERAEEFWLTVAVTRVETFRGRIAERDPRRLVAFVGDRDDIQRAAIEAGTRAVVVVGGLTMTAELRALASRAGVVVARSRFDAATTVLLSRGASRVDTMLERDFVAFHPDTPLDAARARAATHPAAIFPVVEEDGRLVGVLTKGDFIRPIPRQLILVDHNELAQAVPGADRLRVIEVLDHHRLGGFASTEPILYWNNPVGSTSTIVTMCYEQAGVPVPAPIAGLLMAGIITDTLHLTSPTTTDVDRAILGRLEGIAQVPAAQLAREIFAVGSPLLTLSPAEAVTADCKTFQEGGVRFSVAQIEEPGLDLFQSKRAEVAAALEQWRAANNLFLAALLVTDIHTHNSLLLVAGGTEEFRRRITYPTAGPGLWELAGVVSRKKQLLPWLLRTLAEAGADAEDRALRVPPRGG